MKKRANLKRKWLVYAISGILLMGFGLSVFGESVIIKSNGEIWWKWFVWGTISFIIFFSGLSLFGQAVIYRFLLLNPNKNKK
jgi:hypothetical protein